MTFWLGWLGLYRLGAWIEFWTYRRRARAAFIGQQFEAKGMPPPDEFFGTSPAYGAINYLETVWENGDDFYAPEMVEYAAYWFGFMEALKACAPGWVYRQERKALGDALAEMKARRGPPPTSDQFACYR